MDDDERGYRKERPLADLIPPDRRRLRAAALVLGGMIGGAALLAFAQYLATRPEPTPVPADAPTPSVVDFRSRVQAFSVGAAYVDITSPRPGAIGQDGKIDQSFELVVSGPISGIVIASCDSSGRPFGAQRWGTIDYDPHLPTAPIVIGRPPTTGWQLGVFEIPEAQNVNEPSGSLRPYGDGIHQFRLYASDSGAFEPGSYFRAYVIRPDGTVTPSEPLAFTGHGPAHQPERPRIPPSEQAPASPAFDRGAAAAALGTVDVNRCQFQSGVAGNGHITVSFANDGSVSSAEVDQGGNMNTPRGACIASAYRKVRVPPFAGAPVRVGKSFTVTVQ